MAVVITILMGKSRPFTTHPNFIYLAAIMMPLNVAALQWLRLASPALPIGGYSYSQGLETALDLGWVYDAKSAEHWLSAILMGPLAHFDAALLAQACRAAAAGNQALLGHLNQRVLASRESREQRLETEQMAYSLHQLLSVLPEGAEGWPEQLQTPYSLPVVWAVAAHQFAIAGEAAVAAWLWSWLENQVMVLMKAMPMGQSAGQQLISALLPQLHEATALAWNLPEDELNNFAPRFSLAALKHETQYSRLFRS